jgi:hypothetical protein
MIDEKTQEFRERLVAAISANAAANATLAESIDGLNETFAEGFSNLSASIYRGLAGIEGFAVSNCLSSGFVDVASAISDLAKAVEDRNPK